MKKNHPIRRRLPLRLHRKNRRQILPRAFLPLVHLPLPLPPRPPIHNRRHIHRNSRHHLRLHSRKHRRLRRYCRTNRKFPRPSPRAQPRRYPRRFRFIHRLDFRRAGTHVNIQHNSRFRFHVKSRVQICTDDGGGVYTAVWRVSENWRVFRQHSGTVAGWEWVGGKVVSLFPRSIKLLPGCRHGVRRWNNIIGGGESKTCSKYGCSGLFAALRHNFPAIRQSFRQRGGDGYRNRVAGSMHSGSSREWDIHVGSGCLFSR